MHRSLLIVVVAALLGSACGNGSDGAAACAEIREPADPLSIQHVIDPGGLTFLTDPPTSGPHIAGPAAVGRFDEPLAPAAQVRTLEAGGVVVQFDDSIDDVALDALLGGPVDVALAPGTNLPASLVATAWTWKLTCDSLELADLERFVAERTADAPGED